jgi:hypothetical protein
MSKHQCAVEKIAGAPYHGKVTTAQRVAISEECGMLNHGNSLFATEHPLMVSNGNGIETLIRWTTRRARGRGRLVGAGITAAALMALELRRAP